MGVRTSPGTLNFGSKLGEGGGKRGKGLEEVARVGTCLRS